MTDDQFFWMEALPKAILVWSFSLLVAGWALKTLVGLARVRE